MTDAEKKEMRKMAEVLSAYKDQLLARHKEEPLKSPPLFLLSATINKLERLGS